MVLLKRLVVILGIWLTIAAITVTQYYNYLAGTDRAQPWLTIFVQEAPQFLVWAVLTPAILWLGRKVSLGPDRFRLFFIFHAVASYATHVVFNAVWFSVDAFIIGSPFTVRSIESLVVTVLIYQVYIHVFGYWAVLGIGQIIAAERRNRRLDLERIRLREELTAARLRFLRMQVNPHFLYNSLHSVGLLAVQGRTDEVAEMTERLGRLLRTSLERTSEEMITLADEVDLAKEYLDIERIRFGERLEVSIDVGKETASALVPSLLLQPVVENSVHHGLNASKGTFSITISGRGAGGILTISVEDSGCMKTSSEGLGTGLDRLRQRLHLHYGDAATVEFVTELDGATTKITIPLLKKSQGTER